MLCAAYSGVFGVKIFEKYFLEIFHIFLIKTLQ